MSRSIFRFMIVGAVLAFAACPALAQQIQGQVRYADGYRPAFNVPVECVGASCNGYQYTDRSGKFLWKLGSPHDGGSKSGGTGDYTITIKVPGYVTETRYVVLIDVFQSEYMFITLRRDPKASGATPPAVVNAGPPAAARTAYEEGSKAVEVGKPEEGIPQLEKAVTLYPDFLEAHLALGTAYMKTKQWDKADASLRRALKLNPKSAEIYFALAELYRQQKKYPEAMREAQEGLKLDDKSWQGHLTLGHIYADQNDLVKAGPEVGKALEIKPDLAEGYLLAGNLHLKAHQPENALAEFNEYLRLDPNGKYATQAREMVAKLKEALAERKK